MIEQQLGFPPSQVNATFRQRAIIGRAADKVALKVSPPFKPARLPLLAARQRHDRAKVSAHSFQRLPSARPIGRFMKTVRDLVAKVETVARSRRSTGVAEACELIVGFHMMTRHRADADAHDRTSPQYCCPACLGCGQGSRASALQGVPEDLREGGAADLSTRPNRKGPIVSLRRHLVGRALPALCPERASRGVDMIP